MSLDNDVDKLLGIEVVDGGSVTSAPITKARIKSFRSIPESHLLSVRGLSYIKNNAPKSLRKQLNHRNEYKNLTNLLSYYQNWGHYLFPKANFKDFLEMCSKTGTKRRVVLQRKQWIEEELAKNKEKDDEFLYSNAFGNDDNNEELNNDDQNRNNNDDDNDDNLYRTRDTHTTDQEQELRQEQEQPPTNTNGLFVQDDDYDDQMEDDDLFGNTTTANLQTETISGPAQGPEMEIPSESHHNISKSTPIPHQKPQIEKETSNEDNREEEFPEFDEFEGDFEEQYAAEMEAMEGF